MLPCYVMLDLETTGGNAVHDRITEIAAVRVENGVETRRWSSLVNPGVTIPPFIQQLTGITHQMVRDAPSFEALAPTVREILDGAVFVAHNVRFDHGFVLNAFERLQNPLKVRTLCTVRLSRKLYPQHKGHGLDAIMRRHGLTTLARHRAMGDVDVVLAWLKIAEAELGLPAIEREAQALLQTSASLPPLLETAISDIPDSPGVYLFFGEGPLPLYIGKSVTLRTRVMAHFQSAGKIAREMRILQKSAASSGARPRASWARCCWSPGWSRTCSRSTTAGCGANATTAPGNWRPILRSSRCCSACRWTMSRRRHGASCLVPTAASARRTMRCARWQTRMACACVHWGWSPARAPALPTRSANAGACAPGAKRLRCTACGCRWPWPTTG